MTIYLYFYKTSNYLIFWNVGLTPKWKNSYIEISYCQTSLSLVLVSIENTKKANLKI